MWISPYGRKNHRAILGQLGFPIQLHRLLQETFASCFLGEHWSNCVLGVSWPRSLGAEVHTNLKRLVKLQESCKKAEDYKCIFTAVSSGTGKTEE